MLWLLFYFYFSVYGLSGTGIPRSSLGNTGCYRMLIVCREAEIGSQMSRRTEHVVFRGPE